MSQFKTAFKPKELTIFQYLVQKQGKLKVRCKVSKTVLISLFKEQFIPLKLQNTDQELLEGINSVFYKLHPVLQIKYHNY